MKHLLLSILVITLSNGFALAQTDATPASSAVSNVDMLVFQIACANVVHEGAIGIAGTKSKQYKRYETLSANATTDQLIALTSHKNGAVRVYAYKALKNRKYENLDVITNSLEKDASEVSYMNGCILSNATVADIISSKKGQTFTPISHPFKISGISDGRI